MTAEDLVAAEPRAMLERRADLHVARLERLMEAIGRRRATIVREIALASKIAWVAIAAAVIVLGVVSASRRTKRSRLGRPRGPSRLRPVG